jgi:hypothetical protein
LFEAGVWWIFIELTEGSALIALQGICQ